MYEIFNFFQSVFGDPTYLSTVTVVFYVWSLLNFAHISNSFDQLQSAAGKRYIISGGGVVLALFFFYATVVQNNPKVSAPILTCAGLLLVTAMLQMRYISLLRLYQPIKDGEEFKTVFYKHCAERVMQDYSFFRPVYIGGLVGVVSISVTGGSGEAGILFSLICAIILDLIVDYKYWNLCFKYKMEENIYADEPAWILLLRPFIGVVVGIVVAWMAVDIHLFAPRVIALMIILGTYSLFKPFMFNQIKKNYV